MANRPSEPLLAFLRDQIRRKGFTTAQLAERLKVDRSALKQQLAGNEPLTVDDFVSITQALALTPAELGLAADAAPAAPPPDDAPPHAAPDPLGNLPRQVLELGFALGIDLFLQLDAKQLADSGVPGVVLGRFTDELPISLPAKFHRHNKPQFLDDRFEVVLSFDRLYTCSFPWPAFRRVVFQLPEEAAAPPPAPTPPKPSGAPFLRVVK
ncbi:MAG: hypothetical protein ACOZNI_21540 [Myxococcota bacterium]